jgi:hypothetical protein
LVQGGRDLHERGFKRLKPLYISAYPDLVVSVGMTTARFAA